MTSTLVIGDYRKSSWSFRAWLVLKAAGIPFETIQVKLEQADTNANILKYSPSAKVPALLKDGIAINDSLAIAETIAESCPQSGLWPADPKLRSLARAAAAEMHSGFTNLRTQMSFGLSTGDKVDHVLPETAWEIERIFQIWRTLRQASGSTQFLCGQFGIVDAMFAPVLFRFRRYGVALPSDLIAYANALMTYEHVQRWLELAAEQ
jgi:glutathione S-transferase